MADPFLPRHRAEALMNTKLSSLSSRIRFCLALASAWIVLGAAVQAAELPLVPGVEVQPLAAQARCFEKRARLIEGVGSSRWSYREISPAAWAAARMLSMTSVLASA
jgi:hypothetical protein